MTLRILVAPSGFKESLEADTVADCIEKGILLAMPSAQITKAPLIDGGEGFTRAIVAATDGERHYITVTGPTGKPVEASYGYTGGDGQNTAVLEIAAAAGLRLIPNKERNPIFTTSYGVGEIIKAVLDSDTERILIGCGDSGTNDGGVGMAKALGARFLDTNGKELGRGGGELIRLKHIDLDGLDHRLSNIEIEVACNWQNILCGPMGVSRIYGAQKGALPENIEILSSAFENLASVIEREIGYDVREMPGGGASGGLGAGLYAFLGAKLYPRYEIITRYFNVESLLKKTDLVFTAEGAIDGQTLRGKIPSEIAKRAKHYHIPVIVLAGSIETDARTNLSCGINSYISILNRPCTLSEAMQNTSEMLIDTTEQTMRTLMVGQRLAP